MPRKIIMALSFALLYPIFCEAKPSDALLARAQEFFEAVSSGDEKEAGMFHYPYFSYEAEDSIARERLFRTNRGDQVRIVGTKVADIHHESADTKTSIEISFRFLGLPPEKWCYKMIWVFHEKHKDINLETNWYWYRMFRVLGFCTQA